MNSSSPFPNPLADFQLRFQSLFDQGRGYTFHCDAAGRVDLDALSERERINYFSARTLVGRDFALPVMTQATLH